MEKENFREDPLSRPGWQLPWGRLMACFIRKNEGKKIQSVVIKAEPNSTGRYKITATGADGGIVLDEVTSL